MGKRWRNKKGSKQPNSSFGSGSSPNLSLREEATGKKQQNVKPRLMLKLEHLKNLASWACSEGSVPQLGAFFGERLAASAEAIGVPVPPDPSLFYCQRCESILRPGYNCTVRILKNCSKMRRRKKSSIPSQNNVSYKCHFCEDRNLIRGTPKGHMKVICPQKVKPPLKPNPVKAAVQRSRGQDNKNATEHGSSQMDKTYVPYADRVEIKTKSLEPDAVRDENTREKEVKSGDSRMDIIDLADAGRNVNEENCPATPSVKPGISLLDSKMRKRNRSGAKRTESKSISASVDVELAANASTKRKRKGWTSLKEIVERTEKDNGKNSGNLAIPFFI